MTGLEVYEKVAEARKELESIPLGIDTTGNGRSC